MADQHNGGNDARSQRRLLERPSDESNGQSDDEREDHGVSRAPMAPWCSIWHTQGEADDVDVGQKGEAGPESHREQAGRRTGSVDSSACQTDRGVTEARHAESVLMSRRVGRRWREMGHDHVFGPPLIRATHYTYLMSHEDPESRLDPVVAAYLKDVDRTLLRENLRLSHEDRLRQLQDFVRAADELRQAGRTLKR
jgi:hypothetical protein